MADSAGEFASALAEVLAQFGRRVVDRPEQLRGALSDTLGVAAAAHRFEVDAVVAASREGVASQIRDADPGVAASPEQIRVWFDQIVAAGVSLRDAAWATRSWAEVFDATATARATSEVSEQLIGPDPAAPVSAPGAVVGSAVRSRVSESQTTRPTLDEEATDLGDSTMVAAERTSLPQSAPAGEPSPLAPLAPSAPLSTQDSPGSRAAPARPRPAIAARVGARRTPFGWFILGGAASALVALVVVWGVFALTGAGKDGAGGAEVAGTGTPEVAPTSAVPKHFIEAGTFHSRMTDAAAAIEQIGLVFSEVDNSVMSSDFDLMDSSLTIGAGPCGVTAATAAPPDAADSSPIAYTWNISDGLDDGAYEYATLTSATRVYASAHAAERALGELRVDLAACEAELTTGGTRIERMSRDSDERAGWLVERLVMISSWGSWLDRSCYAAANVVVCYVAEFAGGVPATELPATYYAVLDEVVSEATP